MGMELRIAQPGLRDPVQRRGRDDAAKCAADAIALVVGHDEQHVGRTLGRHHARRPPGLGIVGAFLDHAAEFRGRRRELLAVDRGRGAGGTQHAGDLLRGGGDAQGGWGGTPCQRGHEHAGHSNCPETSRHTLLLLFRLLRPSLAAPPGLDLVGRGEARGNRGGRLRRDQAPQCQHSEQHHEIRQGSDELSRHGLSPRPQGMAHRISGRVPTESSPVAPGFGPRRSTLATGRPPLYLPRPGPECQTGPGSIGSDAAAWACRSHKASGRPGTNRVSLAGT